MSQLNPPLTKVDFSNTCWENLINTSNQRDCLTYHSFFWKQAQEYKESGNIREQTVCEILAYVTSARIKPESTEEFFADVFKNLTDEQLDFLAEITPEISDAELQARVADILWGRKRNYQMAQLAVPAYLQSATILESPDHWTHCVDRIERALRLARKIKYRDTDVLAHIEEVLDRYQGEDTLWLSAKLMELLQEHKLGNPVKYAALSAKAAYLAESHSNWYKARELWNIKAVWHRIEKDKSKEFEASMLSAETYVKEAESALERSPASGVVA